MANPITLPKYSVGVGDRFAHEAKAQLQAFVSAAEKGVDIVPVWNKSNREHTFIGSEPSSVLAAAREAVEALGWSKGWHVDADHIEGIIRLLQDDSLGLSFGDIWFNGWKHLPTDRLGPAQGEMLSVLLDWPTRQGRTRLPWNAAFGGGAAQVDPDPDTELRPIALEGGMELTVLSPTQDELSKLAPYWDEEVRKAHLEPGNRRQAIAGGSG